jgi:hypothetical protein
VITGKIWRDLMSDKKSEVDLFAEEMQRKSEDRHAKLSRTRIEELKSNILPEPFVKAIRDVMDFHEATRVNGKDEG